jgi:hypothetical protein
MFSFQAVGSTCLACYNLGSSQTALSSAAEANVSDGSDPGDGSLWSQCYDFKNIFA